MPEADRFTSAELAAIRSLKLDVPEVRKCLAGFLARHLWEEHRCGVDPDELAMAMAAFVAGLPALEVVAKYLEEGGRLP